MTECAVIEEVNMQRLAEGLLLARRRRGMTQEEVATLTGLHHTHYNEIERGKVPGLRLQTLYRLCKALAVSADRLMGLSIRQDVEQELSCGNGAE